MNALHVYCDCSKFIQLKEIIENRAERSPSLSLRLNKYSCTIFFSVLKISFASCSQIWSAPPTSWSIEFYKPLNGCVSFFLYYTEIFLISRVIFPAFCTYIELIKLGPRQIRSLFGSFIVNDWSDLTKNYNEYSGSFLRPIFMGRKQFFHCSFPFRWGNISWDWNQNESGTLLWMNR